MKVEIELNDLLASAGVDQHKTEPTPDTSPWVVGEWYLIRTVTMIDVGQLVSVNERELVLSDACWIASTGRFHNALKDMSLIDEAEPFIDDVIIGRGSIIDATKWRHRKVSQK